MRIRTSRLPWSTLEADLLVVFVAKDEAVIKTVTILEKELGLSLLAYVQGRGFEGQKGQTVLLPLLSTAGAYRAVLLVGVGTSLTVDGWRETLARVVKVADKEQFTSLVVSEMGMRRPKGEALARMISASAEGAWLASYRFHSYRPEPAKHEKSHISDICFAEIPATEERAVRLSLTQAEAIVLGVHLARDLVNTPSSDMGPADMAGVAERIAARDPRLTVNVLNRTAMEALGMGAALAVAKGSIHEPQLVHLSYRPKGKAKKKICVIGKAVTFDSGGLSLKPADGMMTMKCDMGGAAAVIGLFQALPEIAPQVEVHGIFIAVENMPSGTAYRPGDVVKAMNGKTIEVLNTDAEGRLTLADALAYAAEHVKADEIIDLATLTGAAVVAVGEEITALFANNEKLAQGLERASADGGEVVCRLPLFAPYRQLIKSKVADLKNIGGKAAGCITAALFLQAFVADSQAWAHLDIAGPAFMERESRPDVPYGGTGWGVRTLIRYLQLQSR